MVKKISVKKYCSCVIAVFLIMEIAFSNSIHAYAVEQINTCDVPNAEQVKPVISMQGDTASAAEKHLIDVKNIMQYPELPTGCESVALTILLNHMGYDANKMTIVRKYLPKLDFYWQNGMLYGANFRYTFAGNPESYYAYGCYAPCIVTTANRYLADQNSGDTAVDLTGTEFDDLLKEHIVNDEPVLIWITSSDLHEPFYTDVWNTPEGDVVQWLAYEHCVVLTGYDLTNKKIYVADPLVGNTSYDYNRIKQRYNDMGKQAVYIQPPAIKRLYGDLNDDKNITSDDSLLILRYCVELEAFDDDMQKLADVDNDGIITSADALDVLRYSVGLSSSDKIGSSDNA